MFIYLKKDYPILTVQNKNRIRTTVRRNEKPAPLLRIF